MFDEIKNSGNQLPATPPVPPTPAQPAVSAQPAEKKTEDIFAGVEAGGKENLPKPLVFQSRDPASAAAMPDFEEGRIGGSKKRLFVLGGIILGLALLIGGGIYGYKNFSLFSAGTGNKTEELINENNGTATELTPNTEGPGRVEVTAGAQPATESAGANLENTAAVAGGAKPPDSDDDGLSDEEEKKLGTNPNAVDSDNDGLFDFEEVKVYGTDPLNADTDTDGYLDGQEVKGGYNPLGWGKLFDKTNTKK